MPDDKVVAFLDEGATVRGDMMLMHTTAQRHGLTIAALLVGGTASGVSRDGLVTIVAETGHGMAALLVPRADHLGAHLPRIREHVAVRTADPDRLLERLDPA